jgi:hypothetical protein
MKFLEISQLFSIYVGDFCPPGSGSTDLIESETLLESPAGGTCDVAAPASEDNLDGPLVE